MRIVIQRVKRASVSVEEKVVGSIQKGFLVLIGVGQGENCWDCVFLKMKMERRTSPWQMWMDSF